MASMSGPWVVLPFTDGEKQAVRLSAITGYGQTLGVPVAGRHVGPVGKPNSYIICDGKQFFVALSIAELAELLDGPVP